MSQDDFANLSEAYIFTGKEPLKDEVFRCLEARPSVLKVRENGERIVEQMKDYVYSRLNLCSVCTLIGWTSLSANI